MVDRVVLRYIALTPDGLTVYASGLFKKRISIIDVSTPGQESLLKNIDFAEGLPYTIVITPDKVAPYNDYLIYVAGGVINNATKEVIPNLTGVSGAAITPDGKKIYKVGFDTVDVIDTATNQVVDTLTGLGNSGSFEYGSFIGPQDRDNDGVVDQIEGVYSNGQLQPMTYHFTDKHLGGTSEGSIVDTGGQQGKVSVWRAFPGGFYVRAAGGVSDATVNACGKDVFIKQNGEVKTVCGSLTLDGVSGESKISIGFNTFAAITGGGSVRVTDILEEGSRSRTSVAQPSTSSILRARYSAQLPLEDRIQQRRRHKLNALRDRSLMTASRIPLHVRRSTVLAARWPALGATPTHPAALRLP